MTQTFAENENNDLFLDANGNIALLSGVDAVAQNCTDIMEAQLGEMPLALQRGQNTMATVFSAWKPAQFEVQARAMLATISGVTGVTQFDLTRLNGVASYEASITTIYGPMPLSGDLAQ